MKKRMLKVCFIVLASILVFTAGFGLLLKGKSLRTQVHAATITGNDGDGNGSAATPYLIGSRDKFIEFAPEFARQGTVTNPRHFAIINDIDMAGFIHPNATLGNHVILDGQGFAVSNLSSSLFNTVQGPNSVIKNLNFSGDPNLGSGNIAYNFSGTLDNVHNVDGNVLFTTSAGGLVNYSENATFRYCSNSARVRRSPGGNTADVNGGIIGWAQGSLHIAHTFNSGDVVTMGTAEASGGLVGKITNSGSDIAIIELSANEGFINGNRSAGLVGKKEGSGSLVIRESYNNGTISNRSNNPEAAGILALAEHTGPAVSNQIQIISCYNTGTVSNTVTSTTATGYAGPSGIFSKNSNAAVTIQNTYNIGSVRNAIYHTITNNAVNGITSERNYVRQGANMITSALGHNVTVRSDMATSGFVSVINGSLVPEAFRHDPLLNGGYPVLVGLTTTNFIFDLNGGTINSDPGPIRLSQSEVTISAIDSDLIVRVGFDFRGWNTNAQAAVINGILPDGTIENHTDVLNVTPLRSTTYYAVWEPRYYAINVESIGGQYSNANDEILGVITNITIGQNVYLQTGLSSANPNTYFDGWLVQKNNGDWEEFLYGVRPLLSPEVLVGSVTWHYPEQLQLYVNGESLITEEFISKYAHNEGIYFRGVYKSGTALRLNLDTPSGQRNFGTLKVNNVIESFPKNVTFQAADTVKISVSPNIHYSFEMFKTRPLGSTAGWDYVDDIEIIGGDYIYTIKDFAGAVGLEVQAVFKPISYRITVKAQTVSGENITDTDVLSTLISDTSVHNVSLGESLSGIKLNSAGNYRLVHESRDNIKIQYQRTGDYAVLGNYALRTANGGLISLPITTQFLADFWHTGWNPDDSSKSIEVIAIFIKLVQFDIQVNDSYLGVVSVAVRGLTPQNMPNVTSFDGSFATGSTITVYLLPLHDARVIKIEDTLNPLSPISYSKTENPSVPPPRIITFTLAQASSIVVTFEKLEYSFKLAIVDNNSNNAAGLPTTPRVMVGSTIVGWELEDLGLDTVITITKGAFDANEWRFVGWYIMFGDGQEEYQRGNPGDNYDLTLGHAIIIDNEFVEKYLSESIHILIEARFAKVFNVDINLMHANSGTIEGITLGRTRHDAATPLKIFFAPNIYYRFAGIDGLKSFEQIDFTENSVTIYVIEYRDLKIIFVPIKNSIESKNKLPNNGKIEIRADNDKTLGIGDTVALQYRPGIGFERAGWTINNISVNDLRTTYPGSKAKISGNTVSFIVTPDWFNDWADGDIIHLDSSVKTRVNTFLIIGISAIAILVPALGVGVVLLILANKRRKAEYALALQKMKAGKAMLGHADLIKSLKEGQ